MMYNSMAIRKADIVQTEIVQVSRPVMQSGAVRLRVEALAVTANNVTYAASAERVGYWRFFPLEDSAVGVVPAWGFASVVESDCEAVPVGARFYGFYPTAEELTVTPVHVTARGFVDGAEHRKSLASVYNQYRRVDGAPGHIADLEALEAILFPLYATSWLIDDYLAENSFFGADHLVVGSASSKTAIGLLDLLAARQARPSLIGLTSPSNKDFVKRLGNCDDVVAYPDIADKLGSDAAVFVDMAGSAKVRADVHHAYGDSLVYSCAVGASHWSAYRDPVPLPGARPKFFFAPSQMAKRSDEWGAAVLQQKIYESWRRFAESSSPWLQVVEGRGLKALAARYGEIAAGNAPPSEGYYIHL